MKKIFITLLLLTFVCNNSFAGQPITSFDKKLDQLDKLIINFSNLTPRQSKSFVEIFVSEYSDCSPSSSGNGFICVMKDQLCLVNIRNQNASIKCLIEKDLDKLLSST